MHPRRLLLWTVVSGLVGAGAALAATELVALAIAPAAGPVLAVGALVIDLAPSWLKDITIALFGTNDKIVLLVMVGLLVAVLAAAVGVLERRRPPYGAIGLGLGGAIALIAVLSRAEADPLWAVPTVVGTLFGVVVLRVAIARLNRWVAAGPAVAPPAVAVPSAPDPAARPARPTGPLDPPPFLGFIAATAASAAIVGIAARAVNAATATAATVRAALRLPPPTRRAAPIPAGAALDVPGITPLVTPNADFYRIDTALQVPRIDPSQWRLRVTGMVEQEVEIGWDELVALPLQEAYVTLMCVSNEVGGDLTGNALWLGYPIRDILARARPLDEADMVLSRSQDGWTASSPLEVLQDPERDALLAIGMNGELLPLEHGFPARLVVPGLYGYVSATKWVVELEVTRFDRDLAYWSTRGWSERGPVKTHSRIDVPTANAGVGAGTVAVAGIAWAQHTGIERVEVRVDGGDWAEARLAEAISADTWRQWVYEWRAEAGTHLIEVRATDTTGFTQRSRPVPVAPDGAEGYHSVLVQVA